MKNTKPLKVLVFPKDTNPYQDLLYSQFEEKASIKYLYNSPPKLLSKIFILPIMVCKLTYLRPLGYKLLHIHWLYPFSLPKWFPLGGYIAYIYSVIFIRYAQLLRYKIIWTVHNVLPHDKITHDDLSIRKKLSSSACGVIIHTKETLNQLASLGIYNGTAKLIPMGNYIGVYQSDTSKIDARSMIGISKREFVVLFFGAIRNGKGIEDLIKVFTEMTAPNIKLVIVGKSKDANLTKKIIEASAGSNITFVNNYIADKDVAKYIKACDVFCVPFTENTTSSSVILAMSLRRTVIAPSIGSIKDLPRNTGFYYNPLEANDLRRSIELAHSNKKLTDEKSKNAYRYVTKNSWKKSANLTYSLYKELSG